MATVRTGADPRALAFGAEVRRRRLRFGMTQSDLAVAMGQEPAGRSYISRVERGLKSPSIVTAWRLADALGCDLPDLLKA